MHAHNTAALKHDHHYKSLLHSFDHLVHVTVEVNGCEGAH